MTKKPRKCWVFYRIELISLGINPISMDNHSMICGKRGKNLSQPINSPFTSTELGVLLYGQFCCPLEVCHTLCLNA